MSLDASREYDAIAWLYERHWHERFADAAARCVLRAFGAAGARPSTVLDICCGAGHVSARLAAEGLRVTGVDGSSKLLEDAARRLPDAAWLQADVTEWLPPGPFDAAICTFDRVNHVLAPRRLGAMFRLVAAALRPGGLCVFDFNTREAYEREWHKSSFVVEPDHVMIVRGEWNRAAGLGHTAITAFTPSGEGWHRVDVHLAQRCYSENDLAPLLIESGFTDLAFTPASALGMSGDIVTGRVFARAVSSRT